MFVVSKRKPDPEKAGRLGTLVRTLRKKQHLSQDQLAARAEVARLTISNLERGVYEEPKQRTLVALAQALGVDPSALHEAANHRQEAESYGSERTSDPVVTLPANVEDFIARRGAEYGPDVVEAFRAQFRWDGVELATESELVRAADWVKAIVERAKARRAPR